MLAFVYVFDYTPSLNYQIIYTLDIVFSVYSIGIFETKLYHTKKTGREKKESADNFALNPW